MNFRALQGVSRRYRVVFPNVSLQSDAYLAGLRSELRRKFVLITWMWLGTFVGWFLSLALLLQALHVKNLKSGGNSPSWILIFLVSLCVWLYSFARWRAYGSRRQTIGGQELEVLEELKHREADARDARDQAEAKQRVEEGRTPRPEQLIAFAVTDRLRELATLKEQGLLDEEEFTMLKAELLAKNRQH